VALLHSLPSYKHEVLYMVQRRWLSFQLMWPNCINCPKSWKETPKAVVFKPLRQSANQVLFNDYDAVQSEIYWVRDLGQYDPKNTAKIGIYNNYFGGGMGSVVFKPSVSQRPLLILPMRWFRHRQKEDDYTFIAM
jgi:hypothetical protein